MHQHHHTLWDIRHHGGQLFWTGVLCVLLVIVLARGELLGSVGQIARIVIGSVVLLFVPGWWITQAVFAHDEIDLLETIALSFAFSISVVPLLVFYLNLLGVPITVWLVIAVVVGIVTCCILFLERKKYRG